MQTTLFKKSILAFVFSVCFSVFSYTQSLPESEHVLNLISSNSFSPLMEYSIGETIIGTIDDGDNQLSHGFQQTFILLPQQHVSSDINIYPNPTSGILTINYSDDKSISEKSSYKVITNLGELVLFGTLNNMGQLNVSSLPSGIYFISLTNNQNLLENTQKFIKL